ncbi:MAG: beta-glucosidase [Chloroflexi bacterium]|nr:beta-glucosidase [Chloroflexota bacterium]
MSRLQFPSSFIWGTATASFQIEGGRDDRGDCIWDDFCAWPGKVVNGDNGDTADDHYHLYKQDIGLIRSLGCQAYRFSISWPRILPEGAGEVNPKGLDFYDKLVDAVLQANITPFVTLYHWDLPSALQRLGGWAARDTAYRFADYCHIVSERLGDRVTHWITHNEPWVTAFLGHGSAVHAPGWADHSQALQVAHHLLLSHGLAVPILRQTSQPGTKVGITLNLSPVYAASDDELDVKAATRHDGYANRWFIDPVLLGSYPQDIWKYYDWQVPRVAPEDMDIIGTPIDFLGINNYTRAVIAHSDTGFLQARSVRPEGEYTAMDWEVYPQGLCDLLLRITHDYGNLDLYITENGCSYDDRLEADGTVHDNKRIAFLNKYLAAAHDAIQHGAPLRGYFVWSLMDNFEWAFGYTRRFGITYVDYQTQKRYLKDSGLFFRQVVTHNGLETG